MGSSPAFLDPVVLPLVKGDCILDVGCGWGRWGTLLKFNYFEWGLSEPPIVDGIDAYPPNVENAKTLNVYRDLFTTTVPCDLKKGIYTTVLASEILEHLAEEQVERFLESIEAAATQRVIITTPNFECIRDGSDSFLGFNEFDAHKSFITPQFLQKRGYTIVGAGFGNRRTLLARCVGKILGILRIKNSPAFCFLSYSVPALAHTTVAYKDTHLSNRKSLFVV